MQPYCDHLRENFSRRFDMCHAILDSPVLKSRDIDTICDGDGPVLMPRQAPISRRAFIESNNPHRLCRHAHEAACKGCQRAISANKRSKLGWSGMHSRPAAGADKGRRDLRQGQTRVRRQNTRHDANAVALKLEWCRL